MRGEGRYRVTGGGVILAALLSVTGSAAANTTDPMEKLLRDFYQRVAPVYGAPQPAGQPTTQPDAPPHLPDAAPALRTVPADPGRLARPASTGASRVPDGTVLLLTVRIDRDRLVEPLMVVTEGNGFRVDLGSFVQAFEFPILVDAGQGRAEGWFISPDNDFRLDLGAGTVTSRGQTRALRAGEVVRSDGALMIGDWVLKEWFGLEATPNLADLELRIEADELLPFQQRQRREQRFTQRQSYSTPRATLPPAPEGRPLVGPPVVDLLASSRLTGGDNQETRVGGNYAATVGAGLLGGAFAAYLSGDENEPLSSARANLSYYDPDGLAGLGLVTQARFGDISGFATTLLAPSASGQGVYLSNLPVGAQLRSDATTISGDALPGYDVELYRDEQLVGFQRVGENGQYIFENVELFAGENRFRIVRYGPQGQIEEETRTVTAGGEIGGVPLTYQFAASMIDDGPDEGALQSSLATRLAVGGGVAVLASAGTTEYRGERVSDALLGGQYRVGTFLMEGLAGRDTLGRTLGRAAVQTRIGTDSLRFSHEVRPESLRPELGNRRRTEIALSGYVQGPVLGLPYLRYTVGAEDVSDSVVEEARSLTGKLGTQIGRFTLNNDLLWTQSKERPTEFRAGREGTDLNVVHQASFPLGQLRNRFRLGYRAAPDFEMTEFQANSLWLIERDFTAEMDVRHRFETDLTRVQARLNYDMGSVVLSPRLSYDNNGVYGAFLDLRLSTGIEPMTGNVRMQSRPAANDGSIAVQVFLDENENGVFDPGEEQLEGVEVQALQARRSALTDSTGIAILRNVQPFETSDVRIIPSTLPETHLQPGVEGYSARLLPGGTQNMILPVVRSWTVEGRALSTTAQGEAVPLPGIDVVVMDRDSGEVVASTTTLGDGSYSITGLRQGSYRISLSAESLGSRLAPAYARPLLTDVRETTYHAVDLLAVEPGAPAHYPPLRRASGPGPLMLPLGASASDIRTPEPEASRQVIAVRVGQYRSRLALVMGWSELVERTGPLLAGLVPVLSPSEEARLLADRTSLFPLRLGPLVNRDAAELLCDLLRQIGRSCVPALVDWQEDRIAEHPPAALKAASATR
ncbi:MSCRAMM family protein [Oceanibaculum indicum]|uniref:Sporulation domain-containing protein n=1 Tax=Oceanibaculum indicum P24 TaxID=1207063 RepID=K2J0T6_9PROT|nr:carboxypeptidase-like regulatory domain-containing protein [Oceanibaculum indicum]EKE76536.1 sporulation domain-containing protein [Oceanibaculum indicum P24]